MTPGRLRLLSLLAIVATVAMTGVAASANQGFGALAIATAAAGAALLLAGAMFRVILAVLIALLGASAVLVAFFVTVPAGGEGMTVVAIVAGALQVVVGVVIATTARRWPASATRYSRTRFAGSGDPVEDWDALSAGSDPTADR
jgi:hypothetical protein